MTRHGSRPIRTMTLADVLDRVLDRGIVIVLDARGQVRLPRLRPVDARSRLVVVSVETHLDYGHVAVPPGPVGRFESGIELGDGRPRLRRRDELPDEDRPSGSHFLIREDPEP